MLVDDTQTAIRISGEDLRDAAAFHRLERCVSLEFGRSRRVAMEAQLIACHSRLGMFTQQAHVELVYFHLQRGIEPEIATRGAHGAGLGTSADGVEYRCVIRVETREGPRVIGRQCLPEATDSVGNLFDCKSVGCGLLA